MSRKPNINTEAVRQHAATVVRYSDERRVPVSALIRGTIPGLCDEVDALRQESAHMVETLRLRTAALHRVQRSNDQLRRKCLDREATERDVRARLADAENALARVRELADHIRTAPAETWGEPLTVPANAALAFMRGADSAINFATKAIHAALDAQP